MITIYAEALETLHNPVNENLRSSISLKRVVSMFAASFFSVIGKALWICWLSRYNCWDSACRYRSNNHGIGVVKATFEAWLRSKFKVFCGLMESQSQTQVITELSLSNHWTLTNSRTPYNMESVVEIFTKVEPFWMFVSIVPRTRFRVKRYYHIAPVSSKGFLDIEATIECRFTLKRVRGMIITYRQMHRTNKYLQRSSII